MSHFRALLPRAAEQHGLVTPADAAPVGVSGIALVQMARRGLLERVARGVYRVPELAGDRLEQYQEALLRFPAGVLSHDTALDLHELCDINPARVHITVPRGLRIRTQIPRWLTIHRGEVGEDDRTWHEGLAIVTPGRAIIDGIESHVGQRFIDEARAAAAQRGLLSAKDGRAVERALAVQRIRALDAAEATSTVVR